ncbi:MAG TPA: ABC transporter ATP-binding protein [Baekduia sp.]|nr:ABC transporter ATP-binding protein [Baekduia sp.]
MAAIEQAHSGAPPAAAGAAVAAEHVVKRFGELVVAVRDVSFGIDPGGFVLLTGPSGSGKSTLLNLVAGFDVPDAGRVTIDGRPVTDQPDAARFRREVLGFVFQDHHLISGLTALENVEIALLPGGGSRTARRAAARASLEEVGLGARAAHRPAQLSGGERQRVAVARALVNRPRLLLADEPTGALDTAAGLEILALFRALRDRHGMTVLLVSHEQEAAQVADTTLRLRDGRLAA